MSLIASGGVSIAAAALFIVLSVFAGLKDFSLQFSSFADPDLKLLPSEGKSFVWTQADSLNLISISGVRAYTQVVEERVIIKSENKNYLATIKGVDAAYLKVTRMDSMIKQGQWLRPNTNEVVSGWGISRNLSFGVFDFLKPLSLYVPKPGKGQITSPKGAYNAAYVSNVGLFDINEDLNSKYLFSDINLAKTLLSYAPRQISAIELQLADHSDENAVRLEILNQFKGRFILKNREELNDALFKMLNTENLAIYLIFTLVIIIALFNVIGAIIMMILDKKSSLNTLFNLGAEVRAIKSIFFLQGSLMTLVSGCIGLALGLIFVVLQQHYGWVMLTPELPYPVQLKFFNILLVLATIAVLGIVASKIASGRISRSLIQS